MTISIVSFFCKTDLSIVNLLPFLQIPLFLLLYQVHLLFYLLLKPLFQQSQPLITRNVQLNVKALRVHYYPIKPPISLLQPYQLGQTTKFIHTNQVLDLRLKMHHPHLRVVIHHIRLQDDDFLIRTENSLLHLDNFQILQIVKLLNLQKYTCHFHLHSSTVRLTLMHHPKTVRDGRSFANTLLLQLLNSLLTFLNLLQIVPLLNHALLSLKHQVCLAQGNRFRLQLNSKQLGMPLLYRLFDLLLYILLQLVNSHLLSRLLIQQHAVYLRCRS